MGPFDEVLGGMRVGRSLYARFELRAPWGVRFSAWQEAWLVVVGRGHCWLRWEGRKKPIRIEEGGCLIIKPGVLFSLGDAPEGKVIACQSLPTPDGYRVDYGGSGAETQLLASRFSFDAVAAEPLLAPMPPLVHVPLGHAHAELLQATLALIGNESAHDGLGASVVIERLTDVLFVQVMRGLFANDCSYAPGWITALADRRVKKAIHAVHEDLVRPWTVAEMAREAGGSRSSFAAAFTAAVGTPPLEYVTSWRIYRAKMLLSSSDESLAEIAVQVGYDSDTALSRAFKRHVGVAPGAFRRSVIASCTSRVTP